MATQYSNEFFVRLMNKEIDFDTDTFKIVLMATGFVFNRATHGDYVDVSASELTTQYGYTSGGATLTGAVLAQDDTINGAKCDWSNASWSVSGGNLVASGAIIYDDTHASDAIIGYIDFGGDQTVLSGGVAVISGIQARLVG